MKTHITPNALALRSASIVGEKADHHDAWLVLRDGVIDAILPEAPAGVPAIDLGDIRIAPGLIDVHIHGRDGHDVMDATPAALDGISRSLARHGITSFLATTVTAGWERTLAALDVIGARQGGSAMPGARLLGAYSEGLFFCCEHRGAHNPDFFLQPSVERVEAMIAAARGSLKVIALAPEIEGAMPALRHAVEKGVRVVLGHTDATYDQTRSALAAGASGGVYLFNGMRGIHHREPGCAGALLLERCTVEVIADGVHLHPAILSLIARLKPANDILLISDCMCAGGLDDGRYRLGEMDVTVTGGVARTDGGGLAGSTLTLDRAVAHLVEAGDVAFRDAIHMASLYPARFANVDDRYGSIATGKAADLVLLDPAGMVMATLVGGRLVYVVNDWEIATRLSTLASPEA